MENQPTLKARVREFFFSIGLPPARLRQIAICLAVVGVATALVFFTKFGGDDSAPRDTNNDQLATDTDNTSQPTRTKPELTVDQKLDKLSTFAAKNGNFFSIASEIEKRNSTLKQIRQQNQLTSPQRKKADLIQLGNHETLVMKMLSQGIESEKEMQTLEQFCTSLLEHEDPELRDLAGHKLAIAAATKFTLSPAEQSLQQVRQSLTTHKQSFLNDMNRVQELGNIFQRAKIQHPTKTVIDDAFSDFGSLLAESESSEISDFGIGLCEISLFSKFNLATLPNRIRYRDRRALDDLDGALLTLENHPEVQIEWWKILMRSSESFLSTERFEDAATASNIIGELVAKLPDSDERKAELLEILERHKQRASAIGSSFDVSGTTVQGVPIPPSSNEFSLVIFASRNRKSRQILQELNENGIETGRRFRPVVSFADAFTESDREHFETIPPGVIVASDETARKFADAFPVDFYPYAILIDKEGKLVSQNLSLIQAANRIAKIESTERRRRNQLESPTP